MWEHANYIFYYLSSKRAKELYKMNYKKTMNQKNPSQVSLDHKFVILFLFFTLHSQDWLDLAFSTWVPADVLAHVSKKYE